MKRTIKSAIAVTVLTLLLSGIAMAGGFAGKYSGYGTDGRVFKVTFTLTRSDTVKAFVLRGLKVRCTNLKGDSVTFRYPPTSVDDRDKLDNQARFILVDTYDNGSITVRGQLADLGVRFRGTILLEGDYLVNGEDYGDCESVDGEVPWKARHI